MTDGFEVEMRHIKIGSLDALARPEVRTLLAAAVEERRTELARA